jgi:hypothetical protein
VTEEWFKIPEEPTREMKSLLVCMINTFFVCCIYEYVYIYIYIHIYIYIYIEVIAGACHEDIFFVIHV